MHSKNQKILLIGGGTGGHIMPLYQLSEALLREKYKVHLIVNNSDLDKKIIKDSFNIEHKKFKTHYFNASKIHYHFSFESFINVFKILKSIYDARKLIKEIDPDIIFFKGGFVGFPFLINLKYLRLKTKNKKSVQIYLHESDIVTGSLGKMFEKSAKKVFHNFEKKESKKNIHLPLFFFPSKTKIETIKNQINTETKPNNLKNILIFGGSQGAEFLNKLIEQNSEELLKKYNIKLVTGVQDFIKTPESLSQKNTSNTGVFTQVSMVPQNELINDIFRADLVITRAGASIFQIIAAHKKSILIPLPTSARDHQNMNADYFSQKNLCYKLTQDKIKKDNTLFLKSIEKCLSDKRLQENLNKNEIENAAQKMTNVIKNQIT